METIKVYLENMFKNLPKTAEIENLKNEISANMEDRYQELKHEGKLENEAIGIVISEFGNIDELLEEMNIKMPLNNQKENYPAINIEEAREFISLKQKTSVFIASGVSMILFGVSLLILLMQLSENELIFQGLSEDAQGILPVICLFLFIIPAVGLFIYSGMQMERFKFIEEGLFETSDSVQAVLNSEYKKLMSKHAIKIIMGVCLCITSPLAVLISILVGEGDALYGVSVLLMMIAVAVFLFIQSSSARDAYKRLLKLEEFDSKNQKDNKVIGAIAGIIWPLAVCIFLFSGFVWNLWYICWIIFPITGILFGGFAAFYHAIKGH